MSHFFTCCLHRHLSSSHGTSLEISLGQYHCKQMFFEVVYKKKLKKYILQENTFSFLHQNFTYISMCFLQFIMSEVYYQFLSNFFHDFFQCTYAAIPCTTQNGSLRLNQQFISIEIAINKLLS